MTLTAIIILAFAMSTDAFAVAIAMGARRNNVRFGEALKTGLLFGVIEGVTPLIGWALGSIAASYVESWDHWIAFVLLGGLGLRMIYEGWQEPEVGEEPAPRAFWLLALTGFATSIDAMVVGAGLAFVDTTILEPALAIGLATLTMVTIGMLVGRRIGAAIGKRAEVFGGLVLIAIGSLTLWQHLH
ncbi:manganese efflux pump MntP family protein [Massilia sp.]|uniref:manganese efflux pump MntP n=1 Tax=Massilia sp. TaxID=1882437 RepID=UPI0028A24BF4|nr:manganese efflux pump MntP family protein [Massilia sp.]